MSDERIGTTTDCPDCGESKTDCARAHNRGWGQCCAACANNLSAERNHRVRVITKAS